MQRPGLWTVRRTAASTLLLLLVLASTAAAPTITSLKTGRVTGHVRDQGGAPLANAQVFVVGTALNAVTDPKGAYTIREVPEGSIQLRAAFIGYRAVQASVSVRAGRTTVHDFVLEPTPTSIEEITVAPTNAPAPDRAAVAGGVAQGGKVEHREKDGADATVFTNALPVEPWRQQQEPGNTEAYARIEDNRFLTASANPLSTFSVDVDAASYSNVRRFLSQGALPPADAVRLEELVNYFSYTYPDHTGSHPFAVSTDVGSCPWDADHRLVRIGLQAKHVATRDLPPSNLVFLIDVSGSMQSEDKLPLVKQAFRALVQELRPEDRVAIVVYAGAAGLVLPSTSGADKPAILEAIDRLQAGGSTAGGAGLRLAYDVAREN